MHYHLLYCVRMMYTCSISHCVYTLLASLYEL